MKETTSSIRCQAMESEEGGSSKNIKIKYEADFLQWLLKDKERKLVQTCNSSLRYIDEVLSLNNSRFGDYLHLIYPNKLGIKY
jgi:hypothetical protein